MLPRLDQLRRYPKKRCKFRLRQFETFTGLLRLLSEFGHWLEFHSCHANETLLRCLFQDHLDLRSGREVVAETITGADGVRRTHRRASGRALESVFGTVTVSRLAYGARGTTSLHPLDQTLNLPADLFSFGVRRRAAETVAQSSFGAAVATLAKTTGASVANRQLEELAIAAASDLWRVPVVRAIHLREVPLTFT